MIVFNSLTPVFDSDDYIFGFMTPFSVIMTPVFGHQDSVFGHQDSVMGHHDSVFGRHDSVFDILTLLLATCTQLLSVYFE